MPEPTKEEGWTISVCPEHGRTWADESICSHATRRGCSVETCGREATEVEVIPAGRDQKWFARADHAEGEWQKELERAEAAETQVERLEGELWAAREAGKAQRIRADAAEEYANQWVKVASADGAGAVLEDLQRALARAEQAEGELARYRELGNEMAAAIENRWSGPNGCDCKVCTTAKAWRETLAPIDALGHLDHGPGSRGEAAGCDCSTCEP